MTRGTRAAGGRSLAAALAALTMAAVPAGTAAAGTPTGTPGSLPARDQVRAGQWYLQSMGVAEAQRITQGEGQVIAVIDTGVNPDFPDLSGSVLAGLDTWTKDGKGWVTDTGHGTAIAALAAGHGHGSGGADGILGIAPKAKVIPMGVWPPGQRGSRPKDIAVSIKWAVDHGATVICVAGGGDNDDSLEAAVKYAYAHGVPLVGAAGNPPDDATIVSPGSYEQAMSITGLDRSGTFASKHSISAYGVDFAAPGVDIQVPKENGSGYEPASGTSASAAIAAGVVALVRAKYPELSAQQITQQLKDTAVDKGKPGYDVQYGWGAIDLVAALTTPPGSKASAGATPRSTLTPPPPIAADEGLSFGARLAITIAAVAAFLLVVGGLITLIIRAILRRRRTA